MKGKRRKKTKRAEEERERKRKRLHGDMVNKVYKETKKRKTEDRKKRQRRKRKDRISISVEGGRKHCYTTNKVNKGEILTKPSKEKYKRRRKKSS